MSPHTPGPWYVTALRDTLLMVSGKHDIAEIWMGEPRQRETAPANAALISAAPELLQALRALVAEFDKFSRYGSSLASDANEARNAAVAAIARATEVAQ